jgi:cell division septal protein FtsQ
MGLVAVAALAVAATYTPLFAAADIRLDVPSGLRRADVLSLARVNDRSNVFHLDTDAVERRLEGDPRILEARVTTSLPDRIAIEIVPRSAVAVTGTPQALVGADGVVIGPAGSATDLPRLITTGGQPPGTAEREIAAAAAGALGAALRGEVDAVVVATDGTLRIRLAAGFSATFGDASELEAKAESLAALLTWMRDEEVSVASVDLTVPGSPTAKLEPGSASVAIP